MYLEIRHLFNADNTMVPYSSSFSHGLQKTNRSQTWLGLLLSHLYLLKLWTSRSSLESRFTSLSSPNWLGSYNSPLTHAYWWGLGGLSYSNDKSPTLDSDSELSVDWLPCEAYLKIFWNLSEIQVAWEVFVIWENRSLEGSTLTIESQASWCLLLWQGRYGTFLELREGALRDIKQPWG